MGLLGVGMALGEQFRAEPSTMSDGSAWVGDGDDLVRGSSITGEADYLLKGVYPEGKHRQIAQDGTDAVVVVGDQAFTIDPATLEKKNTREVGDEAVALMRGGAGYVVAPGLVTCMDPTGTSAGGTISLKSSASTAPPGVVDADGRLWLAMTRLGEVSQIEDCEVVQRTKVFDAGHDVDLTLAAGIPVLLDRTDEVLHWLDLRSGAPAVSVDVDGAARLQGPSVEGDRVWLTHPDGRLVGIDRDGDAVELDLDATDLLRPEVVDERVFVPSGAGEVEIVDTPEGEDPSVLGAKDLPAAAADDFTTFVQDGDIWYSTPSEREAGFVATDGELRELEIDREELEAQREAAAAEAADVRPAPRPRPPSGSSSPIATRRPTPPSRRSNRRGTPPTAIPPVTVPSDRAPRR